MQLAYMVSGCARAVALRWRRGRAVGPIPVRKFIFSAGRDGARRSASHAQKPFIDRLYRDSEL